VSELKSEYKTQQASFEPLGQAIGTAITNAPKETNSQIATAFNSLGTRVSAEAAAIRKLKSPSQFKGQLSQLSTDFSTVAADLHAVASAATAGNATTARTSAEKLVLDAAKLKQLDNTLTQKLGLPASG
jgi:hypothetical protein